MKELGKWNYVHCDEGIEGWAMYLLTKVLNWTRDEVYDFLAEIRVALKDRSVHAYLPCTVVYGQKPE